MVVSNLNWQNLSYNPQYLYTRKTEAEYVKTKQLLGLKTIRIRAYPTEDTDAIVDMYKLGVDRVELIHDALSMESYYTLYLK